MFHFYAYFMILLRLNHAISFALPFEGLYKLDIIHYNDFHARFEETSVQRTSCLAGSDCLGGFPRLYSAVTSLLRAKPDAVLLNAGDSFQGTYWYTLLKWNVTQRVMNLLPHDAHAIGNHDFDDGPAGLAPYLAHLEAPVVAANMDTSSEPLLHDLYKKHVIVERRGRKIGIIGLITSETAILSSPGAVRFTDEREAARREAAALAEHGVDIVILLSHCGLDVDKDIAKNYGENIDVIVGGHSHSLMWNGPAPSGEVVADTYPVIVQPSNTSDHKVLIVQASAFTKYMGNLSVYFDFRGDYHSWEGGPIFLNRSFPEDGEVKALLAPYAELVHAAQDVVVGENIVPLEHDACVFGECNLGDVYCDAMLEHVKQKEPSNLTLVSIISRGNLMAGIPAGSVTAGMIFDMLPYRDRIQTFALQGRYLLETLEHGVAEAWAYDPFKGPNVLQVGGMRVTFNTTRPAGERVQSVLVRSEADWHPLDPQLDYQVTTAAFLADGGNGFSMVAMNRKDVKVIGHDSDIVEAYIQRYTPLRQPVDGRITMLTKSGCILHLYRLAGYLGLTNLVIKGYSARPNKWRNVFNICVTLAMLSTSVWLCWRDINKAILGATRFGVCIESGAKTLAMVSRVRTLNQPEVIRALARTRNILDFQLSHQKIRSEVRVFIGVLIAMTAITNICLVCFDYKTGESIDFEVYSLSEMRAFATVATRLILILTFSLLNTLTKVTLIMIYFQLRCTFKILVIRVQQIQYELDLADHKGVERRSLALLARDLEAHEVLRAAVADVTSCTEWTLFCSMLRIFTHLVHTAYFVTISVRNGEQQAFDVAMGVFLSSIYILWFAILAESCHGLGQLDREFCEGMGGCLQSMRSSRCGGGGGAASMLERLRRGAEERSARALRLDVLGVCVLDRALLGQILGSVITYSILLVQYQENKL